MRTIITVRHCQIPEDLKGYAEAIVAKLAKLAGRPQHAEVIFDADHGRKVVELQMSLPRGQVKVATAEDTDFRSALEAAARKLKGQLGKNHRRPGRRPVTG